MYILIVFFCLHNIKYLGTKKFQEIEKQPQPKDTPLSLKKKKKSRKYIRKTNSEVFFFFRGNVAWYYKGKSETFDYFFITRL